MKPIKKAIQVAIIMAIIPLFALSALFSQAPQKMSYQAVIRNSTGQLVSNTQIGIRISILQGTSDGTAVYSEIQTPTTNANGLVSIEIGGEAGFETIDWSAGPCFIKTEIAVEAPLTTYTLVGTSQILSVPYALHAKSAENLFLKSPNGTVYKLSIQDDGQLFIEPLIIFDTFTDPRDNRTYKTVTIGTQTWMAENMAYLPSVVGPGTGSETTPYHYVYDYYGTSVSEAKATASYQTYGVLYNWTAALSACPAGWHLPTDAEWTTLENFLIANGYNYDGTTTENKIAKSLAMASGWASHSGVGTVGNTDFPEKRNATGFSALPGGGRGGSVSFGGAGLGGSWWSATEGSSAGALGRGLYYQGRGMDRGGSIDKEGGYSVRCLRD